MRENKKSWLLLLPFLLVSILPIGIFLLESIMEVLLSERWQNYFIMDTRTLVLLIKTILYSLTVALIAVIGGTGIGIGINCCKKKWRRRLLGSLMILIPLPLMIYTLVWMELISIANGLFNLSLRGTGWGISVLVQSLAMIPLVSLIVYDGISKIPEETIEAGMFLAHDKKVFWHLWLPQCRGSMGTATMVVFLLTFNDYSVPSTFAVNTYAMEIFAKYSISLSAADALLVSLPVIIMGLLLAQPLQARVEKQFFSSIIRSESPLLKRVKFIDKIIKPLSQVIIVLMVLVPFVVLVSGVDFKNFDIMSGGEGDLFVTLGICITSVIISLPIMFMAALSLKKASVGRRLRLLMILLPTLVSPSLIGASLIGFWNAPFLRSIYTSPIMTVLAVMVRFMPIGILVLATGLKTVDENQIISADILTGSRMAGMTKVLLPQIIPSLIIASSAIILLGIGELGTTVMVIPPGLSTITVRLYGYLHYGSTEKIVELGLLLVLAVGIVELLVYRLLFAGVKKNRRTVTYDKD